MHEDQSEQSAQCLTGMGGELVGGKEVLSKCERRVDVRDDTEPM